MSENRKWYPEIMYEETQDGISSKIPFIMVPKDENMPKLLFVFESRETGEYEPGPDGEELPIIEMDLYQYASMNVLKHSLTADLYDDVRVALGLETVSIATKKGINITNNVKKNIKERTPRT